MNTQRRDTFLADASDYAAVRPSYPSELLEAAVQLGGLEPGASLLEIGCGTGQATRWFAERGFRVLALDRSEEMVRVARDHLRSFAHVDLHCRSFEELEPSGHHDAIVFALSYHWLDPITRAARAASHLKPGGSLVILSHTHPAPFRGFFDRVQRVYERVVPEWPPPSPAIVAEQRVQTVVDEISRSGCFSPVARRNAHWSRSYTRDEYERLLGTYSDHAALPPQQRRELIHSIGELIDSEYGGAIVRPYCTELLLAQRKG